MHCCVLPTSRRYKWTETFQDDYEAMKEAAAVMKEKATASIREIEELRQQLKEARANSAQVQEDGAELAWLKSEVEQQRLTIQTLKDENDSLRKSEFNALQKVDSVTSLLNHSPGPSPIPFVLTRTSWLWSWLAQLMCCSPFVCQVCSCNNGLRLSYAFFCRPSPGSHQTTVRWARPPN